jgi:hypothetical protein
MPNMPSAAALAMVGIELDPFRLFEPGGFPLRGHPIRVRDLLTTMPLPTVSQRFQAVPMTPRDRHISLRGGISFFIEF